MAAAGYSRTLNGIVLILYVDTLSFNSKRCMYRIPGRRKMDFVKLVGSSELGCNEL